MAFAGFADVDGRDGGLAAAGIEARLLQADWK
jgi:hypothetical protein